MPTAKPTVIIRVKLVFFHFVVIIKVILVFIHFSDSSNHQEDFGFIGRLLFCQFSTFLIILRFYNSHNFQILLFSLFLGSTFLPIFITDYHAKLQPRFSYQCHSCCAIDVQTRFLASSHHKHPACSPIRISVFWIKSKSTRVRRFQHLVQTSCWKVATD